MPATTQEALSTPLLSLMQKMRYRSFLSNVLPMEIPGEGGVPADKDVPLMHMTMRELYKSTDWTRTARSSRATRWHCA